MKSDGTRQDSVGRLVSELLVGVIPPVPFSEGVTAQLRFKGKMKPTDEVQGMITLITHTVDAEEEARALDLEYVRRMTGRTDEKPEQKHESQDGRCKRPPFKTFKGQCLAV